MIKHYDSSFWGIIKYYYNDDGTRKEYPPRKGKMKGEYHQKSWYRDVTSWNTDNFDRQKYYAYNSQKQIINALAKKSYGIVLKDDILYLKKVVGGLMIDETKAKTIKKSIKLNVLKGKSLNEQLSYIENLFNS